MKRQENGLIDRSQWPTIDEIRRYVDGGEGGSFKSQCKSALLDLHRLADLIDAQTSAGGKDGRIAILEKTLSYYANSGIYSRWGGENDHWVFNASGWGCAPYHQKPPADAIMRPWGLAEDALKGK